MSEERNGGYTGRSYKDVVLFNLPDSSTGPPPNPHLAQLIGSLRELMARSPDGVSLSEDSGEATGTIAVYHGNTFPYSLPALPAAGQRGQQHPDS
ncbi:uncharacterized protein LOC143491259 isoform X2 [Brachyhypopomus gauderio]|uniref:uncharacterized protein LOC143491259 isoform X2 n=1 Tax=Brachyhypopomus gauderio TaxID=698409 RepID=UPI0040422BE9